MPSTEGEGWGGCSDLLSGSRLSRMYANLVQQERAYSAIAIPGWPGEKHASALLISAVPAAGVSLEQLDAAIHREVDNLAASGPTPNELQRIKKVCAHHVMAGRHLKMHTKGA